MPPDADDDRSEQRKQRKQQIVAVAKQVFAEFGYHNASIGEIITRANIARGTFYLYFQSKHSVFDSILDAALSDLRARISRIDIETPGAAAPQLQLRANLTRVVEYVLGDQPLTQILLNHNQDPKAEVAERVHGFFGDVAGLMAGALEQGIEMKLIRPCNTRLVAWGLLGAARGMIEYCIAADAPPSTAEIVDEMIALSLRGVFTG